MLGGLWKAAVFLWIFGNDTDARLCPAAHDPQLTVRGEQLSCIIFVDFWEKHDTMKTIVHKNIIG
jgi:hypothetical protein